MTETPTFQLARRGEEFQTSGKLSEQPDGLYAGRWVLRYLGYSEARWVQGKQQAATGAVPPR